jgi:hypothetical protein
MIRKISPVIPDACGIFLFLESEQELKTKADKNKKKKKYFMNNGM